MTNPIRNADSSNGARKTILISCAFLFFVLVPHALAEGFVALAPIPGLTDIQPTAGGLATFFNNLYKFAIGMAAILAVIMIIWGGLEYSTQDSISKKSDGKQRIYDAIFGLVLVLSPVLVFSIINPSILNLSINLPKLDTRSGAPVQTTDTGTAITTVGGTTVTDNTIYRCTTANCSVEKTACVNDMPYDIGDYTAQFTVVCVRPDGTTVDRVDSSLNPFSSYACSPGETLSVSCRYFQTSIF